MHRSATSDGIGRPQNRHESFLPQSAVGSHETSPRYTNGTLYRVLLLLPGLRKIIAPEPVLASKRDSNPFRRRFEHRIRGAGLSRLRFRSLRGSLSYRRIPPAKGWRSERETEFMHPLRRMLTRLSGERGVHGSGNRSALRVHPLRPMRHVLPT